MRTLSTDTGGRAFFDLGDLSEAFPKIEEENGGYYLLGYYLDANVKHDGSWHALRVKVNAPGAHVRSRDGYYAPRDFQHLEKEDRNQQLNDAMNSTNPVVELPIAVETAMFRLNDAPSLRSHLRETFFQRARLGAEARPKQAEFDFAAEVRAVSQECPVRRNCAIRFRCISIAHDFQQVNKSNLVYQGGVVLSPGKYHLKFLRARK